MKQFQQDIILRMDHVLFKASSNDVRQSWFIEPNNLAKHSEGSCSWNGPALASITINKKHLWEGSICSIPSKAHKGASFDFLLEISLLEPNSDLPEELWGETLCLDFIFASVAWRQFPFANNRIFYPHFCSTFWIKRTIWDLSALALELSLESRGLEARMLNYALMGVIGSHFNVTAIVLLVGFSADAIRKVLNLRQVPSSLLFFHEGPLQVSF